MSDKKDKIEGLQALEESSFPSPLDGRKTVELAALAKAIAHPTRVRIVSTLSRRTSCICGEVVQGLPLAQFTVSEHLRILKKSGLARGEIDGPRICYCLDIKMLERLKVLIKKL